LFEWCIDDNIEHMGPEDKESFTQQKARVVNQIIRGNAAIQENGDIIFSLQAPSGSVTALTFTIPKGRAFMSMDSYKERQGMHKMASFMGSMTGQPPKFFSNMDGRDYKFCMGIATLFLAS